MKRRLQFACLLSIAGLVLAGCVPPEVAIETATPTAQPPATETAALPPATDTAPPPATDTAAPPPATDTAPAPATETTVPEATPTADPAREVILILQPGLSSSVASPVTVAGEADSTFEQNLVIQITDQDGAVLTTTPTTIQSELGTRGPFSAEVEFTVAADQPGRISVFSASARDGGLEHLASVEVTLLAAGGTAVINPAAPPDEVPQIFQPTFLETITGGHVHTEGFSEYVFEGTLSLALCGEGGSGAQEILCGTDDNLIASGFAMLSRRISVSLGPTQLTCPIPSPARSARG